ncbi:MAG: DNA polymerase III subunit delta' [Halopseudomonas sp.]
MDAEPVSQLESVLPWQHPLWQRLIDQHQQQRLPHALLLCGEPGLGKAQFAKALGQYLLCKQPLLKDGLLVSCGSCKGCLLNTQGTHPDLVEIAAEGIGKPIKVDQIRALVSTITNSSQQGGYRVVVLGPAEDMNINAANALLKVLEEPGDRTLFAVYSHLPGRIVATVRSRCQAVHIDLPEPAQAAEWLAQQTGFEGDANELLSLAGGAPLAALEQALNGSAEQRKSLYQALKLMVTGEGSSSQAAEKLVKARTLDLLDWWLTLINDMIRYQSTQDPARINSKTAQKMIIALSQRLSAQQMFEFADRIQQYRHYLMSRNNPNERLLLEDLLIDWGNLFQLR